MRHRIAFVLGSVAAAGVLAFALAAAGLGPVDPAPAAAVVTSPPILTPQVDTVYVPAPASPSTVTIHKVVTSGGEHEGDENEGGDD